MKLPAQPTLRDLQRYVHALEAHHGWLEADAARTCFLMGEEVGEVFGAVRAWERADDAARPAAAEAVGEEIVDVLNYLLALANRLDLDLEASFRAKNGRNETRTWS
ncbi:MAG: hypothetical protein H6732_10130 [Alphaproteobacteria bacterium]|nr:hypothetical protein [Alphaproteobacteria bacterium]